jgi:phage gp16-like protein
MAKADRSADAQRRADLARIHILQDQLGLDREQYEAVLWTVGRVESSKDLDSFGRRRVIEHLQGLKQRQGAADLRADPDRPADVGRRAQLQKIEAQLAAGGYSWRYARALARRMYGKDRIEFCDDTELAGIIAALAKNAQRHGRGGR